MSSSCLKLLLALTLFVIISECRTNLRSRKPCKDDDDCGPGFSCIQTRIRTRKKGKICTKQRPQIPGDPEGPNSVRLLRRQF